MSTRCIDSSVLCQLEILIPIFSKVGMGTDLFKISLCELIVIKVGVVHLGLNDCFGSVM